jgi:hypothetical protein
MPKARGVSNLETTSSSVDSIMAQMINDNGASTSHAAGGRHYCPPPAPMITEGGFVESLYGTDLASPQALEQHDSNNANLGVREHPPSPKIPSSQRIGNTNLKHRRRVLPSAKSPTEYRYSVRRRVCCLAPPTELVSLWSLTYSYLSLSMRQSTAAPSRPL